MCSNFGKKFNSMNCFRSQIWVFRSPLKNGSVFHLKKKKQLPWIIMNKRMVSPFSSVSPRRLQSIPSSISCRAIFSVTWILPGSPEYSSRDAVFTVCPQMSYRGFWAPTTPAMTGPWWIPSSIWIISSISSKSGPRANNLIAAGRTYVPCCGPARGPRAAL